MQYTFLRINLDLHVGIALAWHDLECKKGKVVYLVMISNLEASYGK